MDTVPIEIQVCSDENPSGPPKISRKKSRDDLDIHIVSKSKLATVSRDDLDVGDSPLSPSRTVGHMTSFARVRSTTSFAEGPVGNLNLTLKKKKATGLAVSIQSGTGSIRKRFGSTAVPRKKMDFTDPADSPDKPRVNPVALNKISFVFTDRIETFLDFMPNVKLILVLRELSISLDSFTYLGPKGEAVSSQTLLGECPSQIFFVPPKPETYVATEILVSAGGGYFCRSESIRDRSSDDSFGPVVEGILNSEEIKTATSNLKNLLSPTKKKAPKTSTGLKKSDKAVEVRKTVLDAHAKMYKETEVRFSKSNGKATRVQAATVDTLIEILTHPVGRDKQLELDFVMSFDIIMDAKELFKRMAERFQIANNKIKEGVIEFFKSLLTRRRHLFIDDQEFSASFLKWVETLDPEGVDPLKLKGFQLFCQSQVAGDRQEYQDSVENKLREDDQADGPTPYPILTQEPSNPIPNQPWHLDILDFHPIEVARQITIQNSALIRNIRSNEWMQQGWTKGKGPNIVACIDNFNLLSGWSATCICLGHTIEVRSAILKFLIVTGLQCAMLNNFHATLAIVSGLNSAPVTRLLQTWDSLDNNTMKRFDQLKELVSQDKNYKQMRHLLDSEGSEASIPYIGIYLKDLIFVEDGNPDKTEDGMINFEKHEMLSKHILKMWDFAKNRYKLVPVEPLQNYFRNLKVVCEDDLYEESLLRESRADTAPLKPKWEKRGLFNY